jgi:thiamine-phosphate pyrophosphorylase
VNVFAIPRLYAILDAGQLAGRPAIEVCESLVEAGVRLLQYRDKGAASRDLYEAAMPLAERLRRARGTFIVNDRADVAAAASAGGVHLGQDDLPAPAARLLLPGGIIGVSTHTLAQVQEADRLPVDYIAFGPVFNTRNKLNPDPVVGFEGIASARKATLKPLVAIGGITVTNARPVLDAGADSVAVIGDLMAAADPAARAREFLEMVE